MTRSIVMFMAIGVLVLAGCKKKEAGAGNSPAGGAEAAKAAAGTAPLQPAPAYITSKADNQPVQNAAGEVNPFLTQQLQIFIQQKQRMPQSFAELATFRLDSVPIPPEGKKWVIDSATRQVKAMAK